MSIDTPPLRSIHSNPVTPVSTEPQTAAQAEHQTVSGHSERRSSDWDVRNAPKNYLSLVASHVGTAFFSFASVWLVTRYLGSDGYGSIVALVAASQLVQIFLNWSSTSLARFGIEEFVETGKITHSFWSRTLIFVPNLLVLLLLSGLWLRPIAGWLKIPEPVVWLVVVHLAITSFWLHVQYGLQGVKMLRLQGALLAIERGLTFLGLLALWATSTFTVPGALWCYIVPAAALSLFAVWRLRPFVELADIFSATYFRKMLMFSIPLIPLAVVGYLSTSQLDAFFITRYLSTRDLGIYAVATQINGITGQLAILANSVLLSMFVSLKTTGATSIVRRYFEAVIPLLTVLWAIACIVGSLACVVLIPRVFGAEFGEAVFPLWVLLCSSVVAFPVYIGLSSLAHTYSRTDITMYASIAAAVANVVFDFLLIPRYGMVGCAWATVTSGFVNLLAFYFLLRRNDILPSSWMFAATAPALISGLVISFSGNVWLAAAVFGIATLAVAAMQLGSIREGVGVLKARLQH